MVSCVKNCNALLWPPGYDDSVATMADETGGPPADPNAGRYYIRPDGVSKYLRPDGVSHYLQPPP